MAGAGEVGLRKAAVALRAKPSRLCLLDPFMDEESVRAQLPQPELQLCRKTFAPSDIEGCFLVFAATAKREVNALIAAVCAEKNILCNIADAPHESSFLVPAIVDNGGVTIALSTAGQSPALARRLRRELEAWVEKRYIPLLAFLGRLRPLLLHLGLPTEDNSEILREIVASPLADCLQNQERSAAGALLTKLLPEQLHPRIGDLLDGL